MFEISFIFIVEGFVIKSSEESDNKEIKRSNFNEAFYEKIIKKHILKVELTNSGIKK